MRVRGTERGGRARGQEGQTIICRTGTPALRKLLLMICDEPSRTSPVMNSSPTTSTAAVEREMPAEMCVRDGRVCAEVACSAWREGEKRGQLSDEGKVSSQIRHVLS